MSVLHIAPRRFQDSRGWFSETWNQQRFDAVAGPIQFCQDNHSFSARKGTLRGLHFQRPPFAQAKLVRCIRGSIFDVAVDLRRDSPTFMQWTAAVLTAQSGNQLFVPAGYAHGFLTLEDDSEVVYKVDAPYSPDADGGIAWNDPDIGINWPELDCELSLSDKDLALPMLSNCDAEFAYDGTALKPVSAEGLSL